jgi:tetraacyldisaccharide 4'-kinase
MNILSPLGWLYGFIADRRNDLYDQGRLVSNDLGAKTISVGNLTTGGTGKTPLVAFIAETLADLGERVCILTRGYGRKNPSSRVLVSDGTSVKSDVLTSGDEPVELARRLLGKAIVISDRDRVSAAKWALANFDVSVFVLDDAFQHRRVRRDVDVVCIDATRPFGNGEVLPAGDLRERPGGLRRADAIVITRADLVPEVAELTSTLAELAPAAKLFVSKNRIAHISELAEFLNSSFAYAKNKVASTVTQECFCFCGIGNPSSFFHQLELEGLKLTGSAKFPDHHLYSQNEIDRLQSRAKAAGAEALITTAKDAVRLTGLRTSMPCLVVEIDVEVAPADEFRALISS